MAGNQPTIGLPARKLGAGGTHNGYECTLYGNSASRSEKNWGEALPCFRQLTIELKMRYGASGRE